MKTTALFLKALADETRLRIMLMLLENGELCVCDLMATLGLPQSTVSRHLAALRHAGLVEDERRGVWMYYQITEKGEFDAAVFAALRRHAIGLTVRQDDQRRYLAYLEQKKANACD